MLNDIPKLSQSQTLPNRSDFTPIHDLDTELDLHRITTGVHWTSRRVWHENAYPSGHLVSSLFGTCICSNGCWNQFSQTCRVFLTFHFEYPSVLTQFCLYLFLKSYGFLYKYRLLSAKIRLSHCQKTHSFDSIDLFYNHSVFVLYSPWPS